MPAVMNLYLDDSGTRHPDHKVGHTPQHARDWFGMGGVLLAEAHEEVIRARHKTFCDSWSITYPLHSAEIRSRSNNFTWLGERPRMEQEDFLAQLTAVLTSPELISIACVIDRPGYNQRYREKYGRKRWSLCKTAFSIVVDRAAKYARACGAKLRVLVEKSDPRTDQMVLGYYEALRADGPPFSVDTSAKYGPLTAGDFMEILYEFRAKSKTSPLMQIADLCLWPMCIGGYDPSNRPFLALKNAGVLIDTKLPPEQLESGGIKYSCWDLANAEKSEARS
jgi:hypothetical protein